MGESPVIISLHVLVLVQNRGSLPAQARNGVEKWLSAEGGVEEYMVKTCRAEVKKGCSMEFADLAALKLYAGLENSG